MVADFKDATRSRTLGVQMIIGRDHSKQSNRVYLDENQDRGVGMPQCGKMWANDNNDEKSLWDFWIQGAEMLESAGCNNIRQK